MTTENNTEQQQETPESASPEQTRIAEIDKSLADIDQQILKATTSRQWRELREQRGYLSQEKSNLQIKPALDSFDGGKGKQPAKGEQEQPPENQQTDFPTEGGYDLQIPSYIPQSAVTEESVEAIDQFSVLARELSIPPDAAQLLLETAVDAYLDLPDGMTPGLNPSETTTILVNTWGADYTANLKVVHEAVKALGPKVAAYLNTPRGVEGRLMGNDPSVIAALFAYGRGWTRLSPDHAQKRLDRIMADPKSPYWSGQPTAVAEVKALRARASGTAGTARNSKPEVKVPAAPTGKAAVEAKIKELRAHPAYFNRDHASHKEVVEQVSRLYASLDTEQA